MYACHPTMALSCPLMHLQKADTPPNNDEPRPKAKLSQRERKAKHAEFNRQIWESAYVRSDASIATSPPD